MVLYYIYKIVCKDINIKDLYVGSTTNFTSRKNNHKSLHNDSHIYLYQFIRDNGGWDNWDMVEVERFEAIDKIDAHKRERFYIEHLQATLNKVIPTRTDKEYYDNNKEKLSCYRNSNKEILTNKLKEVIICACGCETSKRNKARHEKSKKHNDLMNNIITNISSLAITDS